MHGWLTLYRDGAKVYVADGAPIARMFGPNIVSVTVHKGGERLEGETTTWTRKVST